MSDQIPDTAPGPYYVSCVDAGRHALVSGPYDTHQEALDRVEKARRVSEKHDPKAVFYAFGTCRLKDPSLTVPGALQKNGYDLDLEPPKPSLAERLWNGESVFVQTPAGLRFTIQQRTPVGLPMVRGFGVIPEGRKRAKGGHKILSREQLDEWAADLTEVPNA